MFPPIPGPQPRWAPSGQSITDLLGLPRERLDQIANTAGEAAGRALAPLLMADQGLQARVGAAAGTALAQQLSTPAWIAVGMLGVMAGAAIVRAVRAG